MTLCICKLIQRAPWHTSSVQPSCQWAAQQWAPPSAPSLPQQHARAQPGTLTGGRLPLAPLRALPPSVSCRHWGGGGRVWSSCAMGVPHQRMCMSCFASKPSRGTHAQAEPYATLREQHYAELEVKKSKFLTTAWPISNAEEVPISTSTQNPGPACHKSTALRW